MANTMFEATYSASHQIASTFDMVWALVAGLWNLRQSATQYLQNHPNASSKETKEALVNGLYVHGLNPKRIATELTWEDEEQYITELLLINGIAIFDTWVDSFVDSALIGQSSNQKKKIKEAVKKGDFAQFDTILSQENASSLAGCFHFTAKKQDAYIGIFGLYINTSRVVETVVHTEIINLTILPKSIMRRLRILRKMIVVLKSFPKSH